MSRTVTALLLSCIFAVTGCAPFRGDSPPIVKKCQIWEKVNNGPWKCYERDKVLRDLGRNTPAGD